MASISRAWIVNAGLVLAGLVAGLILCEILLRITGLGEVKRTELYENKLEKGRPYAQWINRKEKRNVIVYNNWGFHDADREKDSAYYRMLFLGDSYVAGNQMPVDSLFTRQVETRLRAAGYPAEVINAGVGGTGTVYQYLLWKEFFEKKEIRVDHVVLCLFLGNDLEDNHPLLSYHLLGNTPVNPFLDAEANVIVPRRPVSSMKTRMLDYFSRYSMVLYTARLRFYLLKRQLRKNREQAEGASPEADRASRADEAPPVEALGDAWQATLQGTLRLIERWHAELSVRQIAFSVVLLNDFDYYVKGRHIHSDANKRRFVGDLEALSLREGFAVFEVTFEAYPPQAIYSFDGVLLGHFNYRGHRVTATQLSGWLQDLLARRGFLPHR